ncbi:MAG: hypothetical protein WCD50_08945 [Onishia taeanensis]|uniref:hypothetical protein n=1 Tax=Onishia taeanensis TaxID=284577 RepID=UPI003C7E42B6
MNRFQRHLLAISLTASIALPLTAAADMQTGAPHAQDPHQGARLEMMSELNLTDEQRDALTEAHQNFSEERQALRDEQRAAIADILTDEQLATLDAARKAHADHPRGKHHRDGKRGEQRRERMEALLGSWNLSDADLATLREAHETLRDEMRALHEQDFDNRDDRRAAAEAIRDEHDAALAEVLNEEQRHALAVLMAPHHDRHPRGHHGHQEGKHRGDRQEVSRHG